MTVAAPEDLAKELRTRMRGQVLFREPMARHTTFKIGGPADLVVIPEHAEELKAALRFARCRGLAVFVLGSGSNILVRDGGIRGLVILSGKLQDLERAGSERRTELFAEELRLAQRELDTITGEVSADDLLGEIFARFCVGK